MPIYQDGGPGFIDNFFSVNDGMSFCFADLNSIDASSLEFGFEKFRSLAHITFMPAVGADGRNPEPFEKFT